MVLGSLLGTGWALPQEMSGPLPIQLTSDEVSYFRVRVPKSVPQLIIFAQATSDPVIWALANGYWPKESHYDISNFPSWAQASLRSDVLVDLTQLRSPSRCDGPEAILQQCFSRAQSGDLELACGNQPSAVEGMVNALSGHYASHAALPQYGRPSLCQKRIGTCSQSACTAHLQGPTRCDANTSLDEGDCVCQQGFCADATGRFCVEADTLQLGCEKVTGRICNLYDCDPAFGKARCEDGLCVCAPGHCSVNGICQPGPICRESDEFGFCEQPVATQGVLKPDIVSEGSSRPTPPPASQLASQCCRILNIARQRDPGRFVRCIASHFYSVENQKKHGVQANLLTDMTSGGEAFDELVFMARSSTSHTSFRADARGESPRGVVKFWFSLVRNASSGFIGLTPWPVTYSMPLRLQELELFRTLEELVSPYRSPDGQLAVQLHEVPLGVQNSARLHFRRDELVLLRERFFDQHDELKLHLRGLPSGSSVLYSRTSPWLEPRSLLDFGHASSEDIQNPARRLNKDSTANLQESVWLPRHKNARYFAILPAADGSLDAYFTGSFESAPPRETPQQSDKFIGRPMVANVSPPAAVPDMEPHWISAMWFGLTFALSSLALGRWILRRDSVDREGSYNLTAILDTPRRLASDLKQTFLARRRELQPQQMYMPVSRSEYEIVSCAEPVAAIAESDDDAESSTRETRTLCPKAPSLSSLKVFGVEIKKALFAARELTSRRSSQGSFDDEDSDGTPRGGLRFSERCEEARGLLSTEEEEDEGFRPSRGRAHSPDPICRGSRKAIPKSPIDMGSSEDFEAMQALLKLRPAARDSVGDDTLEDIDGPLMGTDRSAMLKR